MFVLFISLQSTYSALSMNDSLLIFDIFRWGVWLGRHICETIAQVFKGVLSKNRNLA